MGTPSLSANSEHDAEPERVELDEKAISSETRESLPRRKLIAENPNARPPIFKSTFIEIVYVLVCSHIMMMNSAPQGALQLALPHIAEYYHIEGSQLSWTITSYSLVSGSTILLMSRLADIVGRKRTLLCATAWYALLSLLQGFMKNHILFDVFRGLSALGGAAGPPAAMGIIGVVYPPGRRKNYVMAGYVAGAPVGYVLGVTASGICTQFLTWRAVMWFYAIVFGVVYVLIYFVVPSDADCFEIANQTVLASGGSQLDPVKRDFATVLRLLRELDFLGAGLSIVGLTVFVFALAESGAASKGWATPHIIALLVVGIIVIAGFIWWETRCKNPLMPMFMWRYPGFALVMATVFCGWLDFQGVLMYYASLHFQNIKKYNAIQTTACMTPLGVAGVVANLFVAMTLHRIPGRLLMTLSMSLFVVCALLWALQPLHITYWAMTFPALCLSIIAADVAINVGSQFSMSTVPPNLKSTAAGTFQVVVQISSSIGIAVSTAIVTSKIGNDIENQAPEILHDAYKNAYWFATAVAGAGVVGTLFLKVGTQGSK